MAWKFDIISNFKWRYLLKVSIRFFIWTLHIFRLEFLFNKVIYIAIDRCTPYCQQFLKFLCFILKGNWGPKCPFVRQKFITFFKQKIIFFTYRCHTMAARVIWKLENLRLWRRHLGIILSKRSISGCSYDVTTSKLLFLTSMWSVLLSSIWLFYSKFYTFICHNGSLLCSSMHKSFFKN